MNSLRRLLALPTLALGLLLVAAPAALAAEGPQEKIVLFDTSSPRDVVGVLILGIVSVFVLLAVVNAVRQLAGKRDQADGRFRWR